MADFYVKYGSNSAKLLGVFNFGCVNLKLHQVKSNLFVISRNRKIIYCNNNIDQAEARFFDSIAFEQDQSLFNS